MQALRRQVRKADIYWCVESFLNAASERDPGKRPALEDYSPRRNEARILAQKAPPAPRR